MSCEHHNKCLNNALCHLCHDEGLLKLPKPYSKKKNKYKPKPGSKLEKKIVKSYDRARATINSGSLWFDDADVDTEMILIEAKDTAHITSTGKKSFTVEKEHLDKIITEAVTAGKIPCLAFKYKEDENLYAVMRFNDVINLVKHILDLQEEL